MQRDNLSMNSASNQILKSAIIVLLLGFVLISTLAYAQPIQLSATLASLPKSAEITESGEIKGAFVDLIRNLDRVSNSHTNMVVVPFKRSINNLTNASADYHIPLIKIPGIDVQQLPYAFSTQTLFQVAFVLYTHKDKPLDISQLSNYDIVTDSAHINFFPFPITGTPCLPCAIRKVNAGRIDGFIFAQNEIDPFIHQYDLNNIHRQLYYNFEVKALIPKGKVGRIVDEYLTNAIMKLKKEGVYNKILAPVLAPYNDWQPYLKNKTEG